MPLNFLAHVLPGEGWYCATRLDGAIPRQYFFKTLPELTDFILAQDQLGHTIYHACAAFLSNQNRKRDNARAARSFWADLDVGKQDGYQTLTDAINDVARFCKESGWPKPTFVCSGRGLHIYWPLKQELPAAEWLGYARAFKMLLHKHSMHVDWTRTSDISSILRTPGTHNRKRETPEPVVCIELTGPYDLKDFPHGFLAASAEQPSRRPTSRRSRLTAAALSLYGESNVNADSVAEHCAQIGAIKANPGQFSEPVIYAGIGVLQHCTGDQGRDWFDSEWLDAVDRKFAQHEAGNIGPTTCAHFQEVNPQGCEGCPLKGKITSPIQAGRQINGHAVEIEAITPGPAQSIEIPNYTNRADGLFLATEDKKGKPSHICISAFPIHITGLQQHELNADDHSIVLDYGTPGATARHVMRGDELLGPSSSAELARRGIMVHEPDELKRYVKLSVDQWRRTRPVQIRFDNFGWKDNDTAFLWGNRLYKNADCTPIHGSQDLQYRAQYLSPIPGGSVQRWSAAANQLFAQGREMQSFGLLCSFAAPIMRFHSHEEGGAIVSFVNELTGTGKTTLLESAASVWGRLKGTKLFDEDTYVAKNSKLGLLGNLLCVYDELASRDPDAVRRFVLTYTNGEDRARGQRDGTLVQSRSQWQTILMLASNKNIWDILNDPNDSNAPAYRVLEFNLTLDKADTKRGDELRRIMEANSGWAGDLYLRKLTHPTTLQYIHDAIPKVTAELWRRTQLQPKHRFWIRLVGSVIIAGVIVRELQLLDFSLQRLTNWICEDLMNRSELGISNNRTDVEVLTYFLNSSIINTLTVSHEWRPKTPLPMLQEPRGPLTIRIEQNSQQAFVSEREFNIYLTKINVHKNAYIERMQAENILLAYGKSVTLGAGTSYARGQTRCYVFDLSHPLVSGIPRLVTAQSAEGFSSPPAGSVQGA